MLEFVAFASYLSIKQEKIQRGRPPHHPGGVGWIASSDQAPKRNRSLLWVWCAQPCAREPEQSSESWCWCELQRLFEPAPATKFLIPDEQVSLTRTNRAFLLSSCGHPGCACHLLCDWPGSQHGRSRCCGQVASALASRRVLSSRVRIKRCVRNRWRVEGCRASVCGLAGTFTVARRSRRQGLRAAVRRWRPAAVLDP